MMNERASWTTVPTSWLQTAAHAFETGGAGLVAKELRLRQAIQADASDPKLLVEYQAVSSEVTVMRNAQTSVVKNYKDIDMAIVSNFR